MRPVLLIGLSSLAGLALAQTPSPNSESIPDTRRVGINVKVPSFNAARDSIYELVRRHSGTIIEAKSEVTEKGRRHGSITFRVPAAELEPSLAEVRTLGKVAVEASSSTPNAKEVEVISSRTGLLEKHHGRMEGLLSSKRNLRARDILYVQDRLFAIEADEEGLQTTKSAILQSSKSAGVAVTLFEPYLPTEKTRLGMGPAARFKESFMSSARDTISSVAGFGGFLLKLIVWSPIWVPLVLLGRKYWRKFFPREQTPVPA